MATLCEGQQYALTSHLNHSINKSLIFVKLTDSALKAIEDYLNNKGNISSNSKPSIEFRSKDSQGVISIPSKYSNNVEDEKQRFSFTLSNVDAVEPQGSFQCIRQSKNSCIESFGDINYKMQIHANDDSYHKTKVKMAVVEEQNKKNSTKVIKASDPNVGRKVKVKRHLTPARPTPHSQPTTAQLSQSHPGYSSYNNNNIKPNSPPTLPTLKLNGNTINGMLNGMPNHRTGVTNNSINNTISNSVNNGVFDTNSNELKRSLRESAVHMLALRSLKLSEVIQRLSTEGFKEMEKKELISILNNIAIIRDNVYELSKTGWTEVNADWNQYTNEEKDLVKRRNPLISSQTTLQSVHNGISPLSDCGSMHAFSSPMSLESSSPLGAKSPAISKRSSESSSSIAKKHKPLVSPESHNSNVNAIKSPINKLKTNGYNHLLNGWANKPSSPEQRVLSPSVSNVKNSNTNSTTDLKSIDSCLTNTSHSSPDPNALCLSQQQFPNQTNRVVNYINNNDNNFVKSHTRDTFSFKTNGYHMSNGNGSGSINSSPNSSPDSGTGSHDGSILSSSNSYTLCTNDETPDYLSKYTKILTPEQRAQYKKDFYIEYEEYRRLHRYIENVASKFSELEIRLNTKVEGSDDWNKLMDQIVKEYEDTKSCPKFQKCRKRMFYLHDKLAHIKGLVLDFDRNYIKEKNRFSHKLQVKSNLIS